MPDDVRYEAARDLGVDVLSPRLKVGKALRPLPADALLNPARHHPFGVVQDLVRGGKRVTESFLGERDHPHRRVVHAGRARALHRLDRDRQVVSEAWVLVEQPQRQVGRRGRDFVGTLCADEALAQPVRTADTVSGSVRFPRVLEQLLVRQHPAHFFQRVGVLALFQKRSDAVEA